MNDTVAEVNTPSPQAQKWARYGVGLGVAGLLLFGIVLGPVAIYLGVRARRVGANDGSGVSTMALFAIGLGVFDILFSVIMIVGTIRTIGAPN